MPQFCTYNLFRTNTFWSVIVFYCKNKKLCTRNDHHHQQTLRHRVKKKKKWTHNITLLSDRVDWDGLIISKWLLYLITITQIILKDQQKIVSVIGPLCSCEDVAAVWHTWLKKVDQQWWFKGSARSGTTLELLLLTGNSTNDVLLYMCRNGFGAE